ncbi:uncharacterized protein LOC123566284 [Mercenaria mercenaria]|uniref:uncharacterized protein LOC123566284 n=1 Tax=Mercenaria mercenaria TaxID=6596 RepID=UPI00234F8CF9|nr:uncharacterized protein LOC123566284 [Mercenaria mercenaria]
MERFFIAAIMLVVYASTTYAYRYVGCYEDKSNRILGGNFSSDASMTVEKCVQTCSYEGVNFGGVEYASQCFCGERLKRGYTKHPDSACSTNCAGDSSQKCGGFWKISVYATNNYIGCFVDNPGRILEGPSTSSSQMTTETCLKFCKDAGKRFALTQYSSQCFCGNNISDYQQKDDSECSYNCAGANSEKCGGFWRGSLYVV